MVVRLARTASLGLLLVIVGWSVAVYPQLPARIPTHFDFGGTPHVWRDTSFWSWFALPLIAVLTYGLIAGISWYMRRHPEKINVPNRKKFAQLPKQGRTAVVNYTEVFLHATCAIMLLLFLLLMWGIQHVASGADRIPNVALVAEYAIILSAFVTGPFFVWFLHDRVGRFHRTSHQVQRSDA